MPAATNLQQILSYLKQGHAVVPNMQAMRAVPQFQPIGHPAQPQAAQGGLQGTLPLYGPPGK